MNTKRLPPWARRRVKRAARKRARAWRACDRATEECGRTLDAVLRAELQYDLAWNPPTRVGPGVRGGWMTSGQYNARFAYRYSCPGWFGDENGIVR